MLVHRDECKLVWNEIIWKLFHSNASSINTWDEIDTRQYQDYQYRPTSTTSKANSQDRPLIPYLDWQYPAHLENLSVSLQCGAVSMSESSLLKAFKPFSTFTKAVKCSKFQGFKIVGSFFSFQISTETTQFFYITEI